MKLSDARGQTTVIVALFLTSLLGFSALSIDVGSWWKAKRDMQRTADAAALAGAQALPDTAQATNLAMQYAAKNGTTLAAGDISFSTDSTTNDTISVHPHGTAPGFFSKVFGIDSVSVGARATSRSYVLDQAWGVAPIGVDVHDPFLSGPGCPCFGNGETLNLLKIGPGGFKLINIDGSHGGTGQGTLADWILNGLDDYMDIGQYYSDAGAKFNASEVLAALEDRVGTNLLFPVYDSTISNGSNLQYHVIGWVGFQLTGYDARGNDGNLYGHFTRVIWQGVQGSAGRTADFGDRTVRLVN